jgi:hypothetical protein
VNTISADEYISPVGVTIFCDCRSTSLLKFDLDDAIAGPNFSFVLNIFVQYLQDHLAIKE